MKLLSIRHARAIWLMPMNDMNPRGKYLLPLLLGLIDRYKFQDVPNIQEALKKQQGIKLTAGVFNAPKAGPIAVDFSIFNDGLVADTRCSTDEAELFIKDLFNWGMKEFGIQVPQSVKRQYLSEFHFELDRSLGSLNPKLGAIAKKLTGKIVDDDSAVFEFFGFSFGQEFKGGRTHPQFRIERAENTPIKENRFYSSAPLKTVDHIELVEDVLSLLKR